MKKDLRYRIFGQSVTNIKFRDIAVTRDVSPSSDRIDEWMFQFGTISSATTTFPTPFIANPRVYLGFTNGTDGCYFARAISTTGFTQGKKVTGSNVNNSTTENNYWLAYGKTKDST